MKKPESTPGRTDGQVQRGFRSIDPFNRPPYESWRYGHGELLSIQGSNPIPLEGKMKEGKTQLPAPPKKP